jgi:hypothetical protein
MAQLNKIKVQNYSILKRNKNLVIFLGENKMVVGRMLLAMIDQIDNFKFGKNKCVCSMQEKSWATLCFKMYPRVSICKDLPH